MAIVANKSAVSMKMVFDWGVNPDTGKSVSKIKSFPNVRDTATDDGMFQAAQALGGLQTHSVIAIRKQETYELVSE